jgi:hypothetical protein
MGKSMEAFLDPQISQGKKIHRRWREGVDRVTKKLHLK